MIEKLKASARDVVLAAVAAFVGALSVTLSAGDYSYPVLRAGVIAAAWAAVRAGIGALAAKFSG
jgi:hypothetical protein